MSASSMNCFFFISFIIVAQFIMLNLFVLIIIEQFQENYINPDNPLKNFQDIKE